MGILERFLAIHRQALGEDHPDPLISMNHLASAYSDAEQFDRAIALYEQVLRAKRAQRGADHPSPLTSQTGLARTSEKAGRDQDGGPLHRKTVEAARQKPARNHGCYLDSLGMLGRGLIHHGKSAEAVTALRECLDTRETAHPEGCTTALARSLLGEALAGQQDFAAAKPLLLDAQKALTARRDTIPPRQRPVILRDPAERLVRRYQAWGKPAEAETWKKSGRLCRPGSASILVATPTRAWPT